MSDEVPPVRLYVSVKEVVGRVMGATGFEVMVRGATQEEPFQVVPDGQLLHCSYTLYLHVHPLKSDTSESVQYCPGTRLTPVVPL